MILRTRGHCGWMLIVATCVLAGAPIATAQKTPTKKRKVEKHRRAPEAGKQDAPKKKKKRVEGRKPRVAPRRGKGYLPTRRAYGHVRVTACPRRADGHIHASRLIARSQRVTPTILSRLDHHHRDEITAIIRFYRAHDHHRAIEAWVRFIDALADHHGTIDLDELMMYIAREAGHHEGEDLAYLGRKLHHVQDLQDLLADYIADLRHQLNDCMSADHPCSDRTMQRIDHDLARTRADLDAAETQEHKVRDQFETQLHSAGDYEKRFGKIYEEIYRSVEVRIILRD